MGPSDSGGEIAHTLGAKKEVHPTATLLYLPPPKKVREPLPSAPHQHRDVQQEDSDLVRVPKAEVGHALVVLRARAPLKPRAPYARPP